MSPNELKKYKDIIEQHRATLLMKGGKNYALLLLEDYKDDQIFWSEVFLKFSSEKAYTLNADWIPDLGTSDKSVTTSTGKDVLRELAKADGNQFLQKLSLHEPTKNGSINISVVICRDSDAEYLYMDKKDVWYLNNNHVFHTHTYSIENHNFNGERINFAFNQVDNRLGDDLIDFIDFFHSLSLILCPFFCYRLYIKRNIDYEPYQSYISRDAFTKIVNDAVSKSKDGDYSNTPSDYQKEILVNMANNFEEKIQLINDEQGITLSEDDLKEELKDLKEHHNIDAKDIYLYMRGHTLLDDLLIPIIEYQYNYIAVKNAPESKKKELQQLLQEAKEGNKAFITKVRDIFKLSIAYNHQPVPKILSDLDAFDWIKSKQ